MKSYEVKKNHMEIPWHDYAKSPGYIKIDDAALEEKAVFIGRVGLMLLSSGTGAWRVRMTMVSLANELNITCSVDVGLTNLQYTAFDGTTSFTQVLAQKTSSVDTRKMTSLERFVDEFDEVGSKMSVEELHSKLDNIESKKARYKTWQLGVASGFACSAFAFLLGAGWVEMVLTFLGAFLGNATRVFMTRRGISLFLDVAISVSVACITYVIMLKAGVLLFGVDEANQAAYICAMLFIIPGFPFLTSGIDFAKLDMRSGLERGAYAIIIIVVATMTAWLVAEVLGLQPADFEDRGLSEQVIVALWIVCSYIGVFGFSIMFNSSVRLAGISATIGSLCNTLRLCLVNFADFRPAAAAFIGAFLAGILASVIKNRVGYPRISITVPSIVIMIPGLYLYTGIFEMANADFTNGVSWIASACLIILALPMGLIFARLATDPHFRKCT